MPVSEFSRPREVADYNYSPAYAPRSGMPTSLQVSLGGLVFSLLTAGLTGATYRKASRNEDRIHELEERVTATEHARKQFFEQVATQLSATLQTVVEQGIAQIVARMQQHPQYQAQYHAPGPPPPGTGQAPPGAFYPTWQSSQPHSTPQQPSA